jgi:pseudouridine synthase
MKRTDKLSSPELIRINRYLSMCGVASRRKADELVVAGKVEVNGKVMTDLGAKIHPGRDKVFVDGKQVAHVHDYLYLVMNKPKDTITTLSDEKGRTTVMSWVSAKQRIYPIGRLDRNTTGVLLLTNDGEFANRLMHPKFEVPKSYQVTLETALTPEHAAQLRKGVKLEDGTTAPAEVHILPGGKGKEIGITIHEGRNRQVRRMFESLGYEVKKLDRVAYGPITKEGLRRGETRSLTRAEVRKLMEMAGIVTPP